MKSTSSDEGLAMGASTSSLQFVGLSPATPSASVNTTNNSVAALRQLYDKMAASVTASESISELLDRLVGELEAVITLTTFGFYIVESSDSLDSLQLVHSQMAAETREAAAQSDRH